jgi:hypothetical protein
MIIIAFHNPLKPAATTKENTRIIFKTADSSTNYNTV